jgi:hypothetical protein
MLDRQDREHISSIAASPALTRCQAVNEFAIAGSDNLLTGNPFDTELRPGTSSAGSAAAVSDYQCHVAIGSQTVSINQPNQQIAE